MNCTLMRQLCCALKLVQKRFFFSPHNLSRRGHKNNENSVIRMSFLVMNEAELMTDDIGNTYYHRKVSKRFQILQLPLTHLQYL